MPLKGEFGGPEGDLTGGMRYAGLGGAGSGRIMHWDGVTKGSNVLPYPSPG